MWFLGAADFRNSSQRKLSEFCTFENDFNNIGWIESPVWLQSSVSHAMNRVISPDVQMHTFFFLNRKSDFRKSFTDHWGWTNSIIMPWNMSKVALYFHLWKLGNDLSLSFTHIHTFFEVPGKIHGIFLLVWWSSIVLLAPSSVEHVVPLCTLLDAHSN